MRYKLHLLSVLILLSPLPLSAQQMYMYSQYRLNDYAYNPAVISMNNGYRARINGRFQWAGMEGAPQTYMLSVYGPDPKRPMGYGGMFYYDMTGPTSRAGLMASYGYMLHITEDIQLSMGLSLGFISYIVDGSKFDLGDNPSLHSDPAMLNYTLRARFLPDASIGCAFFNERFFVGLSGTQLFYLPAKFYDGTNNLNYIKPSIYLVGGYFLYFYDVFSFEPSAVLKYTYPSPFQFEVSAKCSYYMRGSAVWAGLAYRFMDAASFLVGYEYGSFIIGYSFDFSLSSLGRYSFGSHEIVLGYNFDKIK